MGYLINCIMSQEREGDYSLSSTANELFEYCEGRDDGHGNLCHHMIFDKDTKKASFIKEPHWLNDIAIYRAIPSALLMYRLACLFPGSIKTLGREGYKFVWQFSLKHKSSDCRVTFGEWKGGSLFWTIYDYNDIPEQFKKDLEALLTILVSDRCPHPYDGLIAGGVA